MWRFRLAIGLSLITSLLGGCGSALLPTARPLAFRSQDVLDLPSGGTTKRIVKRPGESMANVPPPPPGCQHYCTQIGSIGGGPDPNTCWEECSGQTAPPTTSSVPPGCEEHCTASLPPQCHTVCPQPETSGTLPGQWGRGGVQAPWPADPRGAMPNPPQGPMPQANTGNWPRYVAGQGATVNPWAGPPRRWAPLAN